jgi:DNA helicase-2/ATP-dependent DNA helicase PcrA
MLPPCRDVNRSARRPEAAFHSQAVSQAIARATEARASFEAVDVSRFRLYGLQRQYLDFLETVGLREELVPDGRGSVVFYNLAKFSQAISDFESIHWSSRPEEKYISFAWFLVRHAEHLYSEGLLDNAHANPNAVRIMTVHQAKGLEWPVVFMPALLRNRFPAAAVGGMSV